MVLDGIFGKKYKLETSEKFDEYMKALGKLFFVLVNAWFKV